MSDRQKTLFSALVSVHSWADLQEKWSLFTAKEKGDRFVCMLNLWLYFPCKSIGFSGGLRYKVQQFYRRFLLLSVGRLGY
jgi:hypothetical protein